MFTECAFPATLFASLFVLIVITVEVAGRREAQPARARGFVPAALVRVESSRCD
jgi:hypothetical protein